MTESKKNAIKRLVREQKELKQEVHRKLLSISHAAPKTDMAALEWLEQLVDAESSGKAQRVPTTIPTRTAVAKGYNILTPGVGKVGNSTFSADMFPVAGKDEMIVMAHPFRESSILTTVADPQVMNDGGDGERMSLIGPYMYSPYTDDGAGTYLSHVLFDPFGERAVLPRLFATNPVEIVYHVTATPNVPAVFLTFRPNWGYTVRIHYSDNTFDTIDPIVNFRKLYTPERIIVNAAKTIVALSVFARSFGSNDQGTATNGRMGQAELPWFRLATRALYERYNAPVAGDVNVVWTTPARSPYTCFAYGYDQLSDTKADFDRCASLNLLISNRSPLLNQGGSIATAFVGGQNLLSLGDADLYSNLLERRSDSAETDAVHGSYCFWKPTRERDFQLTALHSFDVYPTTISDNPGFIIAVIRPSAESTDFRVQARYVTEFHTSSQLFDVECSPPLGMRPALTCYMLELPAVTMNDGHREMFAKIFRTLKTQAYKAIRNPANWRAAGALVSKLL